MGQEKDVDLDEMIAQAERDGGGEEEGEEVEVVEVKDGKPRSVKVHVQRYKGLGEMNAEELWETTMDPARRVIKQVMIEEAVEADKVFDMLMGSDVAPRKAFIRHMPRWRNLISNYIWEWNQEILGLQKILAEESLSLLHSNLKFPLF
jgi:DNA gyrase/topoisomerase IV subunit B